MLVLTESQNLFWFWSGSLCCGTPGGSSVPPPVASVPETECEVSDFLLSAAHFCLVRSHKQTWNDLLWAAVLHTKMNWTTPESVRHANSPLSALILSRISFLSARSALSAVSSWAICNFSCCSWSFHFCCWETSKALPTVNQIFILMLDCSTLKHYWYNQIRVKVCCFAP